MKWSDWFSIGYGLEEWKRDRHTFIVVLIGWLIVDIGPLVHGTLDWPTFLMNARYAVAIGVVSVLKNYTINNR